MGIDSEDDIVATKEAVKEAWLHRPGVTGMDVGFKYVGGERTTDVVIRLFVHKKLPDVASEDRFPSMLGKHKTDVIEREFKPMGLPDTTTYPKLVGGVQIGGNGSTAGMFVLDNVTGQLMLLSTFHGGTAPNSPIFQAVNGERIGYRTSPCPRYRTSSCLLHRRR